jgi:hypothetical protein
MKKLILLFSLTFLAVASFSQVITRPNPGSFGVGYTRVVPDSTLYMPTGCGIPVGRAGLNTKVGQVLKMAAQYYDSCGHKKYTYHPETGSWVADSSGGGGGSSANLGAARNTGYVDVNDSASGTHARILVADTFVAGALSPTDKKKLDRIEIISSAAELRTVTNPSIYTIYRFTQISGVNNITIGDFYWSPTSTATDDSVMIVKVTGITTGRMLRYYEGYLNVKWFGAKGDGTTDDWAPVQKAVFTITRNDIYPRKLFFPRGPFGSRYVLSKTIVCANLDATNHKYIQTSILLSGDPGNTRLATTPTELYGNFKNGPVVCYQLCKGGGAEGLSIMSTYVGPTVADSTFYSSNLTDYYDATVRDDRYSPQCLIAVDPFSYGTVPPGGGYPGLTSYYTTASSQPFSGSGSTGQTFYDLQLQSSNIGIIYSSNGATQNAESMTVNHIFMVNCRIGFVSCQTEEKSNKYTDILAWGGIHTLFANGIYGAGGVGQIYVADVNMAGKNNRFISWNLSGFTASYFNNIYSESLGRFGELYGGYGVVSHIDNSIFGFATISELGGKMPAYHIFAPRDTKFSNSEMRMYGTGLPIILTGSAFYDHIGFEALPSVQPNYVIGGSIAGSNFTNCYTTDYGGIKQYFGMTGLINAAESQMHGSSTYGKFEVAEQGREQNGTYSGYKIDNNRVADFEVSGDIAITVNSNRTVYLTHNPKLYSGMALQIMTGSYDNSIFAGIVTNTGAGGDTVSYVPRGVETGTYKLIYTFSRQFVGFIGDVTSGSPYITKVKLETIGAVFPGNHFYSNLFGGIAVVTRVSNDTITVASNAGFTQTGNVFRSDGVTRYYSTKDPSQFFPNFIPNDVPFKKGDWVSDFSGGRYRRFACITEGLVNGTGGDTRVAVFKDDFADVPNYWSLSGGDISNNNSGNVGIGGTPDQPLTVTKSFGGLNLLHLKNLSAVGGDGAGVQIETNGGSSYMYRGSTANTSTGANNTYFQTTTGGFGINTAGIVRWFVDSVGHHIFSLGSDAPGDMWYRNASGFMTRLPAGTSSQILHGGTAPSWKDTTAVTGGGGGGGGGGYNKDSIINAIKDSVVFDVVHQVSTTNSTATTIDTLAVANNQHITYSVTFHAVNTTAGTLNKLRFMRLIDVSNTSGTVTKDFEDSPVSDQAMTNITGCSVTFTVVGSQVIVQVVGLASNSINWTVVKSPVLTSGL